MELPFQVRKTLRANFVLARIWPRAKPLVKNLRKFPFDGVSVPDSEDGTIDGKFWAVCFGSYALLQEALQLSLCSLPPLHDGDWSRHALGIAQSSPQRRERPATQGGALRGGLRRAHRTRVSNELEWPMYWGLGALLC